MDLSPASTPPNTIHNSPGYPDFGPKSSQPVGMCSTLLCVLSALAFSIDRDNQLERRQNFSELPGAMFFAVLSCTSTAFSGARPLPLRVLLTVDASSW